MPRDPHLDKLINDLKAKQFRDKEGKRLTDSFGEGLKKDFGPILEGLKNEVVASVKEGLKDLQMPEMPQMPEVRMPDIPAPIVNVPAPVVNVPAPVVNVPAAQVTVNERPFPQIPEFPKEVSLRGVNKVDALPVIIMDGKGKPAQFGSGGVTGGKGDFFTIVDIQKSIAVVTVNPDGEPFYPGSSSSSSSTTVSLINRDGFYYNGDNPLPVTITSGASSTTATNIVDSTGVAYSGSNPLPVTFSAAASQNVNLFDGQASTITSHSHAQQTDFRGIDTAILGVVNVESVLNSTTATLGSGGTFTGTAENVLNYAEIRIMVFADQASATDGLSVQQSSNGTNWDITDTYTIPASTGKAFSFQPTGRYFRIVYTNGGSAQGAFRLYPTFHHFATKPSSQRTRDAYTNETDLEQVWAFASMFNGSTWDRMRSGTGDSAGALRVVNSTDAATSVNFASQSVAVETRQVSGATYSVVVNSGTLTSITNTVTTNQLSGAVNSVFVTGAADSFCVYEATTTNPTAKSDGADVRPMADDLGRQVFRPIHVRDLIRTAYTSVSNGTETTLITAAAGTFNDLIMVTATNNSTAATQLDIRAVSGGNIIHTMYLPATTGPVGWAPPVPWPQDATGNAWTIDMPDQTGTTVYVSALFSTEV